MALSLILRNLRKSQGVALLSQGLQISSPAVFTAPRALGTLNRGTKLVPLLSRQNVIVKMPKRSSSHGDHSFLWTAEKVLSAALLGIIPSAFLFSSSVLDNLLVVAVVVHQHWGVEAMVVDYVRPILFGPVIPKVSLAIVYVISAATLGGLLYFNHSDVGVTRLIKNFWAVKGGSKKEEAPEPGKE